MLSRKWIKYADEMTLKSKAYRRFNNAIKTDATKSNYAYAINRFMMFLKEDKVITSIEDCEFLLTLPQSQVSP